MCVISLDVAKAFDTVSHFGVIRALKRANLDDRFISYIQDNLKDANTIFDTANGQVNISVNRGVKQGDPLSPLLFNTMLDELVCGMADFEGIKCGENKIRCLAYADDVLLFATQRADAVRMLERAEAFLTMQGMTLNLQKCKMLELKNVPSTRRVYVCNTPLDYKDSSIHALGVGEYMKYLGSEFSEHGETQCSTKILFDQLQRLKRAPLKPVQKLVLLKQYLLPRQIALYQKPTITVGTLKEADRKIRQFVRLTLHLSAHSHSSLLYASVRDGGLGIFNLRERIPSIILGRVERLAEQVECIAWIVQQDQTWLKSLKKCKLDIGMKTANNEYHARMLNSSINGCGGLKQMKNNGESSTWLHRPPPFWSGDDYIKAVKLRYNDLPCKAKPYTPANQRKCRAPHCRRQETNCHILQNCSMTHVDRIERHNVVQKQIVKVARENGWTVEIEKHVYSRDGSLLKPDLILTKGDKTVISDMGVHWEGDESLSYFFSAKSQKYSGPLFIEKIKQMYPSSHIHVLPYIMGARGAWCKENVGLERIVGLTRQNVRHIVTGILKGGFMTHSRFMRSVWEPM